MHSFFDSAHSTILQLQINILQIGDFDSFQGDRFSQGVPPVLLAARAPAGLPLGCGREVPGAVEEPVHAGAQGEAAGDYRAGRLLRGATSFHKT